jgi:hypothetical protein
MQRIYTRHSGFDDRIVERKAWERREYANEARVARNAVVPFAIDKRGRRIAPDEVERLRLRSDALENLQDVATAIVSLLRIGVTRFEFATS